MIDTVRTNGAVYSVETLKDGSMGDLMITRSQSKDFSRITITDGLIVSDPFLCIQSVGWRCELIHVSTGESIVFTVAAGSGRFDDAIAVINSSPIVKSLKATGWLLGCPWLVKGDEF